MTARLETGIELLDRKLNGGVPVGSLTALSAPPASQAELLLYELATIRPTLYLTLFRPADDIKNTLAEYAYNNAEITIEPIDPHDPIDEILEHSQQLDNHATLVIDPIEILEQLPVTEYWDFLIELKEHIAEADGTGVLYCLHGHQLPPRRDLTEYMADIVFRMSTERTGESIENDLTVPKFRGDRAIEDVIKLSLTTDVEVDISRNIV